MITTTSPTPAALSAPSLAPRHSIRSAGDDLRALPSLLRAERIKLTSLRATRAVAVMSTLVSALAAWAVATWVTDEVLTVTDVFVYPAVLTAALSAVAGIVVFTSEAQHGTLAATLTARPARWLLATAKAITAVAGGIAIGAAGMIGGVVGSLVGGLEVGALSGMPATIAWALLYSSLAALIGLGVGMVVRHSSAAISGLLVWWFVVENMVLTFAPAKVARLLPFDAGYRILGVGSDFDTPEILAIALTPPQYALIFAGYAAATMLAGSIVLHRRDTN
ncbi:MAG: hypothetical protein JJE52_12585 [Acidimicrobiia bacterium]|nr:hypothetical protein [Acidimicrobiia bacterium]